MRHPTLVRLFNQRNAIRDVAAACGISTAAVASWRTVPPERAEATARALGVDVDSLPITGRAQQEAA